MADDQEIVFKDPPPAKSSRRTDHSLIATTLREHPGEWALVLRKHKNNGVVGTIKNGHARAYRPAGSFEATAREADTTPPSWDIYARYVGTEST